MAAKHLNGPIVSILMPVKNTEKYLEECLDSILNQKLTFWELIAVDDSSADNSYDILQQYSGLDPRIRIFRNKGKGIIEALRLAYRHASGQYITRMDSDDRMSSDKLLRMSECLRNSGKGSLAVGLVEYFAEGQLGQGYIEYADWLNSLTLAARNYEEIYRECVIPSPCWMCHRDDLDKAGAFESGTYPEDYDLCFRFRSAGLRVVAVPRVLHYWRDHPLRSSRTDPHYSDNRFLDLKMKYFIRDDLDTSRELVVWGAGKKGKHIAKILIEKAVLFRWICQNARKSGQDIYGVILEDADNFSFGERTQLLLAVAQRGAKKHIKEKISGIHPAEGFQLFSFS